MLSLGLGTKHTWLGLGKHHVLAENTCFQGLLSNKLWFHTCKCWTAVLNGGHWLGNILTFNPTTVPCNLQMWKSDHKPVMWMWRDMFSTNVATWRHFIIATGLITQYQTYFYVANVSEIKSAFQSVFCVSDSFNAGLYSPLHVWDRAWITKSQCISPEGRHWQWPLTQHPPDHPGPWKQDIRVRHESSKRTPTLLFNGAFPLGEAPWP